MEADALIKHCLRATKLIEALAARVQTHAATTATSSAKCPPVSTPSVEGAESATAIANDTPPLAPEPAAKSTEDCGHVDLLRQCHDFREAFEDLAERYISRLSERDTVEALQRTVCELRELLADEVGRREDAERSAEASRHEFSRMLQRLHAVHAAESTETIELLSYVRQLELENETLRRLVTPVSPLEQIEPPALLPSRVTAILAPSSLVS